MKSNGSVVAKPMGLIQISSNVVVNCGIQYSLDITWSLEYQQEGGEYGDYQEVTFA